MGARWCSSHHAIVDTTVTWLARFGRTPHERDRPLVYDDTMAIGRRTAIMSIGGATLFGAGWLASSAWRTWRARRADDASDGGAVVGRDATAPLAPSGGPLTLLPSDVGTLDADEKATLWEVAVEAGRLWNAAALERATLLEILDAKTKTAPSYLAEYRFALAEAYAPLRSASTAADAVARIWAAEPGRQQDDPSFRGRAGYAQVRMKRFVVGEFLALHLAYGGFGDLGFDRVPGYQGRGGAYAVAATEAGRR